MLVNYALSVSCVSVISIYVFYIKLWNLFAEEKVEFEIKQSVWGAKALEIQSIIKTCQFQSVVSAV